MTTLSIDFESRSTVDLRRTGVYPYAIHPSTEILCMAWAFDDDEPEVWTPAGFGGDHTWDSEQATRIWEYIEAGGAVRAWNAQFERIMWWAIMHKRFGFPLLTREQTYDTAADAAALALPRALNRAALVLGLDEEKDDAGYRLMMKMCKPRKRRKADTAPEGTILWHEEPEQLRALYEYCKQDVRVERAVGKRIRPLGPHERQVYLMDQLMNDRGVRLDVPLIHASQALVDEGMSRANTELGELTDGAVTKVTQRDKLMQWLEPQYAVPNLQKATLRDLLALEEGSLPPDVQRALEIRSAAAKSSTAKLTSMLEYRASGDRARGMFLYHGAGPGRWAGKGPQPQNYTRPLIKDIEGYVDQILAGATFDEIAAQEPPLAVVSSALRSMLVATPGHRLIAGDYGQIEARVLAWFAGQWDLVQLFADGGKVYEEMAAYIYNVDVSEIENPSEERQTGKNTILGCGFQMGVDTYIEQAKIQTGIIIPQEMGEKSVNGYRERFSLIPVFWKDINNAAKDAVRTGHVTTVGHGGVIKFVVRGQFLWCILPSGRPLAYAMPELRVHTVRPKDPEKAPFQTEAVMYSHVNSLTKRWQRRFSYGGMWTENVVQATARDLLASAMLRLEAAGYPLVMTVHDEAVADVPNEHGSLEEFLEIMADSPQWAKGLPVAVDGWEGARYRK